MFNPYLRALGHVPRWTILPRLRQQNVAEHSYFVTLYVMEILETYCGHFDRENKYSILQAALAHDAAEARMGDEPGPVKRSVTNREAYKEYERKTLEYMDLFFDDDYATPIIKVADLIEEIMYLTEESIMGNKFVTNMLPRSQQRLHMAIHKAGLPPQLYYDVIFAARSLENFEPTINDSDVQP